MIDTVPHHDHVGGDPMAAAEPLLVLGWSMPAALTVRVAIERQLLDLAEASGLDVAGRPPVRLLSRQLGKRGLFDMATHKANWGLLGELNRVAHGEPVSLFEAARMFQVARRQLELMSGCCC